MSDLKKVDRTLLQRVAQGAVSFTHAADITGRHTKLVRSTLSPSQQKHLHRLAVAGYLVHTVTGCNGRNQPPEHTVTFTLSALGREVLGIRRPPPPRLHGSTALTDAQLEAEGIE